MEDTNNIVVTTVSNDFEVDTKSLVNLIAYGTPHKPKTNAVIDHFALYTLSVENSTSIWTENIVIMTSSLASLLSLHAATKGSTLLL